jgi:hypothetical protein
MYVEVLNPIKMQVGKMEVIVFQNVQKVIVTVILMEYFYLNKNVYSAGKVDVDETPPCDNGCVKKANDTCLESCSNTYHYEDKSGVYVL